MIDDLTERLETVVSVAAQHARDVDTQARFPRESIGALKRAGLLGLTVPPALGGLGGDTVDAAQAITQVAQSCASTGMIFTMHLAAMAVLQTQHGAFEDVLAAAAAGQHLSTLALSERATRSNFWVSMGHCHTTEAGWRLELEKSFVTSAGPANSYVVSAATPGRDNFADTELFLVHADDEGVAVLDWWQGSGLRGNSSAPMRFACDLPAGAHIGPAAAGQDIVMEAVIPMFQLGAACVSVGLCLAAVDATKQHILNTTLEHLGERLIDQPVVRHSLGRLIAQAHAVDGFVKSTAADMAAGTAQLQRILEVKAVANDVALEATDRAMRLGGGAAYSGRTDMDRLFRDSRAGMVMAPTADMLYDMVGRVAADMPPF